MDIRFHGFSCFSLAGQEATVLIDPYDGDEAGLKLSRKEADVVLANEANKLHDTDQIKIEEAHVFNWPGEYEAKKVNVVAVQAMAPKNDESGTQNYEGNALLFSFELDGIRFAHLSNLGHKLDSSVTETIGEVDVLFIPVGGNGVLSPKEAHAIIEDIDPRIVIPMYYDLPKSKLPYGPLESFLKEVGNSTPRRENVLKIKSRSDLPVDTMEYVVLEAA